MMLMTKFGKFKLRFIATINLSVLMSILSLSSTFTNYWVKYTDRPTQEIHYAGMWRSCSGIKCIWKNGIVENMHTLWSICVRFFIMLGTCGNVICFFLLVGALFYKSINKSSSSSPTASCANANGENGTCNLTTKSTTTPTKSTRTTIVIGMMEWANVILCGSFISMLIGFCIFMSSECTLSLWLHCLSMCFIIGTSNLLTRTFAELYFQNTRQMMSKNVETTISHSKLADYNCAAPTDEEKMALTAAPAISTTTETTIEMQKMTGNEATGSKEALIQPITTAPTIVNEIIKTAISNTNLNSQPETVISMTTSNKAINKC
jgi:hypothetical protein